MDTKTVYEYDNEGYFKSEITLDNSDISPGGEWNIPAKCTVLQPETKDGYKPKWTGTAWEQEVIPHDVLCYYADGLQYKTVKSDYVVADGEVLFEQTPTTAELEKAFSGYDNAVLSQTKSTKLAELQSYLSATDYKFREVYDGSITTDEYEPYKTLAIEWRKAYNDIQTATTLEAVNAITYTPYKKG